MVFKYFISPYISWRQQPKRHQLCGHLPPTTKTIQVRRSRHAGHCWKSRDELISDEILWTPTYDRGKAGRPARTYIQQLCEDTRCGPEELPAVMNDREKWREGVRDDNIYIYIYIYIYVCVCVRMFVWSEFINLERGTCSCSRSRNWSKKWLILSTQPNKWYLYYRRKSLGLSFSANWAESQ